MRTPWPTMMQISNSSFFSKKQEDLFIVNFSVLLVNFIFFAVKMKNVNLFYAMVLAESAWMCSLRRIYHFKGVEVEVRRFALWACWTIPWPRVPYNCKSWLGQYRLSLQHFGGCYKLIQSEGDIKSNHRRILLFCTNTQKDRILCCQCRCLNSAFIYDTRYRTAKVKLSFRQNPSIAHMQLRARASIWSSFFHLRLHYHRRIANCSFQWRLFVACFYYHDYYQYQIQPEESYICSIIVWDACVQCSEQWKGWWGF
jgi:hypothetical protein